MASLSYLLPSTPPPERSSPSLPKHRTHSTHSTTRVIERFRDVTPMHNDTSSTSQAGSGHNFTSPTLPVAKTSRETTVCCSKENFEKKPTKRKLHLKLQAQRTRDRNASKCTSLPYVKANVEKGIDQPMQYKTPSAPRINRLPTPELSDLDDDEFCACCDVRQVCRETRRLKPAHQENGTVSSHTFRENETADINI